MFIFVLRLCFFFLEISSAAVLVGFPFVGFAFLSCSSHNLSILLAHFDRLYQKKKKNKKRGSSIDLTTVKNPHEFDLMGGRMVFSSHYKKSNQYSTNPRSLRYVLYGLCIIIR